MKVLVIGGGGREHAVCKKLSESPMVDALLCAPGNAGIAQVSVCVPEVKATDVAGIVALAKREQVDFVCVTPDSPRALDAVDLARYLSDRDHWVAVADQVATGAEGAEFRARVMNGVMVACGSLYMAADVRRYFGRTE